MTTIFSDCNNVCNLLLSVYIIAGINLTVGSFCFYLCDVHSIILTYGAGEFSNKNYNYTFAPPCPLA